MHNSPKFSLPFVLSVMIHRKVSIYVGILSVYYRDTLCVQQGYYLYTRGTLFVYYRDNKVMAACTLGSDPVAAVIAELMYTNQLPPADQIK